MMFEILQTNKEAIYFNVKKNHDQKNLAAQRANCFLAYKWFSSVIQIKIVSEVRL